VFCRDLQVVCLGFLFINLCVILYDHSVQNGLQIFFLISCIVWWSYCCHGKVILWAVWLVCVCVMHCEWTWCTCQPCVLMLQERAYDALPCHAALFVCQWYSGRHYSYFDCGMQLATLTHWPAVTLYIADVLFVYTISSAASLCLIHSSIVDILSAFVWLINLCVLTGSPQVGLLGSRFFWHFRGRRRRQYFCVWLRAVYLYVYDGDVVVCYHY